MNEAVIALAKRTPIGKIGGIFKELEPEYLAAQVIKEIINESNISSEDIDDVILGNTVGMGGNLARKSVLLAGLPLEVPGVTVDRQCGSGLEAINIAARLIQSGAGDIYLAGGMESTSRAPWKVEKPLALHSVVPPRMYTRASFAPECIGDPDMGIAAENVAEFYKITKEEQDEFAYQSHQKAIQSMQTGRFKDEIVPIRIPGKHNHSIQTEDECPRKDTTLEKINRLSPVFKDGGTVTAGNACPINDGAAIVLLMSKSKAMEMGFNNHLTFIDSVSVGVDPNYLGIGPIPAVKKLLERNELSITDVDLVELNEAFASQVLASIKELNIPLSKLNIGGGAIALGHPYGASGALLVTRLFAEMQKSESEIGIATLGIGGGQGLATLLKTNP
ncbi:thiolase family protein [Bacillus vallismortis]|uniref:thiolase family protein n=1 Tax=Bacillus vallismortis TaxID=72361 RepID=UPI0022821055|nr:thiolase family protein [Bacillus vallismortis]MCI4137562.1 thiolase family protein [Bacillus vallismortis]MCY7892830.1 thiolase family protein [Bacillus vallismortis]